MIMGISVHQKVMDELTRVKIQIDEKIGQGNFSEVYLGSRNKHKFAIKIQEKSTFERFQDLRGSRLKLTSEVETLSKLNHVRIISMFEWFQTETCICLISEWMCGGDLLQALLNEIYNTEDDKRRIFIEICEGLMYLHHEGFIHRDLKPENCLLTSKNPETAHLKIADVGLTVKVNGHGECRTFCGSLMYMAPEIFKYKQKTGLHLSGYGFGVDMWSLGVTLYILMSGEPPFEDNEFLEQQILLGRFEFDGAIWKCISTECEDLVKGLMLVDQSARLTVEQTCNDQWVRQT